MKIVYTRHALEKFKELEKEGWRISKRQIIQTIKNPKWFGLTRSGQETVLSLIDKKHIIRVVLVRKDDIIKVITFHLGKRGRYESTL